MGSTDVRRVVKHFIHFASFLAIGTLLLLPSCEQEEKEIPWEPKLVVSGAYPDSGPTAGGTSISVFGVCFEDGATVSVGGNPATSVVFVDANTLTCVTPAGTAGLADVTVTNPGGLLPKS